MGTIYAIQHAKATNDTNGNPRRCFTVDAITDRLGADAIQYTKRAAVFDEGYGTALSHVSRWCWARLDCVAVVELGAVYVTPADYRRLVEQGEHLDETNPFRTVFVDGGEHHAFHRTREAARREVKRCAAWSELRVEANGDDLHYPDGGGHRGTAPTTDGAALDRFERKMAAHRADGHTHTKP